MTSLSARQRQTLLRAAWLKAQARAEVERFAAERQYELRGNNLAVQEMTDPEILLVGPAGTGKTLGWLVKIHRLCLRYPGLRVLIARKVRADVAQTTLVTFERDVLGQDNPICKGVQREYRQAYRYPNGSEIVVGGMDRPSKILSGEYDIIYAAEAIEFDELDIETFVMRLRNGKLPYQQLIMDTNPGSPKHWLKQRADGGRCKLLNTYHKDNPAYWDTATNDWTPRGRDYVLGKLQRLSGVWRARYLEGKWTIAEGAVYDDYNEALHVIPRFVIPPAWRRIRVVDFGFANPFVCQWWAIDPDGRMYLYHEIYMTQRTVKVHADLILRLTAGADVTTWKALKAAEKLAAAGRGERIEATVADHDAEDRATLKENGIPTVAAKKEITVGIQAVQTRLKVAGDGKPRLFIFDDALVERDESLAEVHLPICTADEFPMYVWPKGQDGRPNKETPVDLHNHGMDCVRYAVRYVDGGRADQPAQVATRGLYGKRETRRR